MVLLKRNGRAPSYSIYSGNLHVGLVHIYPHFYQQSQHSLQRSITAPHHVQTSQPRSSFHSSCLPVPTPARHASIQPTNKSRTPNINPRSNPYHIPTSPHASTPSSNAFLAYVQEPLNQNPRSFTPFNHTPTIANLTQLHSACLKPSDRKTDAMPNRTETGNEMKRSRRWWCPDLVWYPEMEGDWEGGIVLSP